MEITCAQMDILLSFYVEGDLSKALKEKVEEHLKTCSSCRAKYDMLNEMLEDLRASVSCGEDTLEENVASGVNSMNCFGESEVNTCARTSNYNNQYKVFQNNLSAYIDNELPNEENIKIKKYTINNKKARKDLEDSYNIKRIMNNSFNKTKDDVKQDFSKSVMKELSPREEYIFSFHPVVKFSIAFVFSVLIISAVVIFSLTL